MGHGVFLPSTLNDACENTVGSAAFAVHMSCRHSSIGSTLLKMKYDSNYCHKEKVLWESVGLPLRITCNKSLRTSSTVLTLYSVRFSTYTPLFKSSLSCNHPNLETKRKRIISHRKDMVQNEQKCDRKTLSYLQISRRRLKKISDLLVVYL